MFICVYMCLYVFLCIDRWVYGSVSIILFIMYSPMCGRLWFTQLVPILCRGGVNKGGLGFRSERRTEGLRGAWVSGLRGGLRG